MSSLRTIVLLAALVGGCAVHDFVRPVRSVQQLEQDRQAADESFARQFNANADLLLQRVKAELDSADGRAGPPVVNLLLISGGADWGAFAAGFLKGWQRVPPGPMAMPRFDVVTGVSTGALIAPFAYLGDPQSLEDIESLYRHPPKDLYEPRGAIALLRGASAYARVPGLEQALDGALEPDRIARIADERNRGRLLAVNVTNVDTQEMRAWDLVAEAKLAVRSGNVHRIHDILLASAAIPGLFPPRQIDGVLYVDGGVTGNILFGGPFSNPQGETLVERWQHKYPGVLLPTIRYWILFNNEIRWPPEIVAPTWSTLVSRSMTASTRAATLNCVRLLMLQARVEKLRNTANIEVRIAAVPDGWVPPKPGAFVPESMNALADLGERLGSDPQSWRTSLLD